MHLLLRESSSVERCGRTDASTRERPRPLRSGPLAYVWCADRSGTLAGDDLEEQRERAPGDAQVDRHALKTAGGATAGAEVLTSTATARQAVAQTGLLGLLNEDGRGEEHGCEDEENENDPEQGDLQRGHGSGGNDRWCRERDSNPHGSPR